jgi:fructoselysine-6-phosphate deglycase
MAEFDEERFLRIVSGAVAASKELGVYVQDALNSGFENLFFAGAGGAGILMLPAAELLRLSSTFPVFTEQPAQLVLTRSASLGKKSLVVVPSLSGTTPESVELISFCKSQGATVIGLTGYSDSPVAASSDFAVTNFAEDDTSCESFYLQSLGVALAVMDQRGEIDDYDAVASEIEELPTLLADVKKAASDSARDFATYLSADSYHVITGSGGTWPEALYYGMCILEEMQWIRTSPVHAADFFHGPLELIDESTSVILLKGEDATRPLVERVERFLETRTSKALLLDAAGYPLPGISPRVRALISPVILATVLERVSAELEVIRDHPLTTRRYYRKVPY